METQSARLERERLELKSLAEIYGSALPLQLMMERNFAAENRRGAGLPSSNFSLEILCGLDDEIPFIGNAPTLPGFVETFDRDAHTN
jgi:hypothetical protein